MLSIILVLAAVIIIILIVLIARLPENRYKNIKALTTRDIQEIASLKMTLEKIKSLEDEKRNLIHEIDKGKKGQLRRLHLWVSSFKGRMHNLGTKFRRSNENDKITDK
jgi:hypothetical protein